MKLAFTPQAWADYSYWQETDPQVSARIRQLIKDAMRDPHRGIGKPEPLSRLYKDAGRDALPASIGWYIRFREANS